MDDAMIKIAICDDENNFIKNIDYELRKQLDENRRTYQITSFNNGEDLIEYFNNQNIDAIFLDIDMPNMTGFEVAEKLQQVKRDVIIIFITSHEDKVYQSWEFQPFWFVRKSHMDDLRIVLPRLLVKVDSEREKEQYTVNLIAENRIVEINITTVQYIQSYNHCIILKDKYKKDNKVRCKMTDAEKQLYPFYFIRVQNSVLVNSRFISKITSRNVILHNGEEISISRNKLEYVKNEFQKYIRSR